MSNKNNMNTKLGSYTNSIPGLVSYVLRTDVVA